MADNIQETLGGVRESLGRLAGAVESLTRGEDRRDVEMKSLETRFARAEHELTALREDVADIRAAVHALKSPVDDLVTLKARAGYIVTALVVVGSAIWTFAGPFLPNIIHRLFGLPEK